MGELWCFLRSSSKSRTSLFCNTACIKNSELSCAVYRRKQYLPMDEEMREITFTSLHIGLLPIRNPYRTSYPGAFENTLLLRDFNS